MTLTRTSVADLAQLADCARDFYAASQFLRQFDIERFRALWTQLIESGAGVIFSLSDETGAIAGTLGGVAFPETYSGALVASEFFWFVRPGHRGEGLRLYRAFEDWAREHGCAEIRMVHLIDSMPRKLDRVYRRLGFVPAEVHYTKALEVPQ